MRDVSRECVQMEWCEVVEWGKRNALSWFGHSLERMKRGEFVKKVDLS